MKMGDGEGTINEPETSKRREERETTDIQKDREGGTKNFPFPPLYTTPPTHLNLIKHKNPLTHVQTRKPQDQAQYKTPNSLQNLVS